MVQTTREDRRPVQVYELPLEADGSPSKERTYVRLPAPHPDPYVLRLSIDAGSKASKGGVLHTNFPLDRSDFQRKRFHKKSLPKDLSKPIEIDLIISRSGAYEFYIEYDADEVSPEGSRKTTRVKSKGCYFNVDPVIEIPKRTPILSAEHQPNPLGQGGKVLKDSVVLPLDGLVIQTIISKWMGPLDAWKPHLDLCRDRGYNMLHFAPIQQRGSRNSPYSIYDQLAFDDALFSKQGLSTDQKNAEVKKWLTSFKEDWGLLSLIDVVLNHTADNSPWLEDHPEAGYNIVNSPHLEAAVELDTALFELGLNLEKYNLPTEIRADTDVAMIVDFIRNKVIPDLRLWEFYVINVSEEKKRFSSSWSEAALQANGVDAEADLASMSRGDVVDLFIGSCLPKAWHNLGPRYGTKVSIEAAVPFVRKLVPRDSPVDRATEEFGRLLDDANVQRYQMYDDDVKSILSNTAGRIKYTRVDDHGPKWGKVSKDVPLVDTYFVHLPVNERTKKHDPKSLALATNGWIWDADPLQDFASAASRAYIRRDVIGWGDCVKLRYGSGPDDSPWLWQHMAEYVKLLASLFHGFRIDNCHSTPIHVGEYFLDVARRVNPNLYVCAELFTGREEMDVYFVSRLGLNSLIREAGNGHDPKDMSRLFYIYGVGKPVGSMDGDCLTELSTIDMDGERKPCAIIQHTGSKPHAFMMDCTHDNESPSTKRTAEDALSTGSLVTFCWSAIGSNKGYDDLYAKLLDVVNEPRQYQTYKTPDESGIGHVKRVLNHLHTEMALGGYIEGHLHQENDYIISHRVHPQTHRGYIVIAHCAFSFKGKERGQISPVTLRHTDATYILGVSLEVESREDPKDPKLLKGLPAKLKTLPKPPMERKEDAEGYFTEIVVPDYFPPGSVMVFATEMEGLSFELDSLCVSGAKEAFSELDLVDLNVVLFRSDGEERDATDGRIGSYTVPGLGALPYCGLEGWMHPLRHIMRYNDLGHPLCGHLRDGAWAFGYVVDRLQQQTSVFPRLSKPAHWFKERFDAVSKVPAFMRPRFFAMIINSAYKAARDRVFEQCSDFIRTGHSFTQALALCAVQVYGRVKSASLDPSEERATLAAGLPHFAAGWARCWGRDVFISLRGLFLTTGQFDAAREHILAFASTLKHGLIPNLLDSVRNPRYNSRDSPWWFVQNIQDYVTKSPEGVKFLSTSVKRRFPLDDTWVSWDDAKAYAHNSTVAEVIQEILQRHASGIHFREHNAGPNLDMQMSDEGFNIDIEVDWETGLILGGNASNCGTWMDKMGESEKAGNKGLPGTPRDGAPVEITGLLASTLRWVDTVASKGHWPAKGVQVKGANGSEKTVTYKEWYELVRKSFEPCYYVPADESQDSKYRIRPDLVSRRGIYKDVYGTGQGRERADYQLRCNFPIAMAVAPELFHPEHAMRALEIYEEVLYGSLGVCTLDPKDPDYRGYYDNSNDSSDRSVAKGWNYHRGPPWGWPAGYYLRALIHFDTLYGRGRKDPDQTIHRVEGLLSARRDHIRKDRWAGLPELTNEGGQHCRDSCETQAWSASTILDALEALYEFSRR